MNPIRSALWALPITLLASCSEPSELSAARPAPAVKMIELHNGGMAQVVEYPGQIRAVQQTWKAFEVAGRIIELPVKEGQEVKKGQLLARLDPRHYQSARDFALAQYETAKVVADRLVPLLEKNAVSRQDLDLAQRDLRTAAANLEQAEKALEETRMVADFDGKVADVLVRDFANVNAKDDVMVIQDDSSLEIVVQVPETVMAIPIPGETDAEKVANAHPVVVLSALPGREFPVEYSEAAETPDPVTRTFEVTLAFTPPDDVSIRPGMTAKLRAIIPANDLSRSQGYPVPLSAVFSDEQGQAHLWRVDPEDMTVIPVPVQLGALSGDSVVAIGDLDGGEMICTSGIHQLRAGQQIRVWQPR